MKPTLLPFEIPRASVSRVRGLMPKEPAAGKFRIPVCAPSITEKEVRYATRALRTSWVSGKGEYVGAFERAFAKRISGTTYAAAVNSGTSALHLALLACNIGPGDEVIVPAFTMIASANAVRYCGATPVFVDADRATWNLETQAVEAAVTGRTKAIMPVHIYGLPADMDPIRRIAKAHDLWIIEDAAEAHGALYKGRPAGSLGDIAAFSLYANKIVTTGQGGMIATNNRKLDRIVRTLRSHAFTDGAHFWHRYVGYSYEMTNLAAAVGLAQVERSADFLRKRKRIAHQYHTLLRGIPGISFVAEPTDRVSAHWVFGIVIDRRAFGMTRDRLRAHLARSGIETRAFFTPVPIQPPYIRGRERERFPVAEMLGRDGLYLPSGNAISDRDVRDIARSIQSAAKHPSS